MNPKQTTKAKVTLPGLCAAVIAPAVETAAAEEVFAPAVVEAEFVAVAVMTMDEVPMSIVTVVVPSAIDTSLPVATDDTEKRVDLVQEAL
ncbi:hypothetical protein FKW77_005817 [Venturia effusa]|uniref:Uncharacterized protein n=1 Tax=Venturia effusa TaxID=50376 RepID=A0A517KZH5_9PEZI|nr:hypothetical protein FKW77_005817 [Venturia effusa]